MKLLSFGEVLWDIYPDKKCLGGAPLNFAAHFVKAGGEADIITAVGNDSLGAETLEGIRRLGSGHGLCCRGECPDRALSCHAR